MANTDHEHPRTSRKRARLVTDEVTKLVESVNALPASRFYEKYYPAICTLDLLHDYKSLVTLQGSAADVSSVTIEQCLKLIEQTSADDYKHSEIKWSIPKKRIEMKLPDMKYLILTEDGKVIGFVSFMITYEDGYEVLYIYEIHFTPEWQGKGLGKKLINVVENIGRKVGVTKVMLTVFKANQRAVDWYINLGYAEDEFSPGPRTLRNGTVKEPSYIILSKPKND
ncbi:N alpha-acetyl-transferase [Elasticomyces elasticus]|uniref:N-alpha-acetyltransferase 40 n=1 Tax=Exophiala sideris TaxID=1016849 RepID=A0ABR0J4A6_9EURO|nr:N alpha-acetyl-transferase [Elasticomyces elasticus]KAK5027303.1 N alpha-acetyl-transferase [Exophiala sideris]KAK5034995.1 N alpha-acetyl-transferase [Exophiala sideris]KAK5056271.1 N alpha-acetyl-transferase [Exophiala sideris]KAK5181240.1 N alpha-acetyl-transferase [Eurotiomycetes sp. CCFEE 6388]